MADRRLKVFHTVARLLNFTKAADALHMTQPAVTFQIRQLEEYFNTRLFDRTHNRVSLTEAGQRVYTFSDRIFELYDEMENAIREMTGDVSGVVTLGASTTIAEYMLPFLLGDFKSIEARGLALLAGDPLMMKQFQAGEDLYIEMAARIFNKSPDEVTESERDLGKQAVLGCGYGMYFKTFLATCLKFGISVTPQLAKTAVDTYRSTYPKVPEFWYSVERLFRAVRRTGGTKKLNSFLSFTGRGSSVSIDLPTGRSLYYHKVQVGESLTYGRLDRGFQKHIYGGLLVENIVQAVCRDILVNCMQQCFTEGLNPVLHIHDEIVCLVPKKGVEQAQEKFTKIVNTPPPWFPGFPLVTETEICTRYHK